MGQKCCCCCRKEPPPEQQDTPCLDIRLLPNEEAVNPPVEKPTTYEVLDFVVALHSYKANGNNELSFDQGDTLEVINKDDEDWWLARYPGHANLGYIPVPYVALSSSLESHEWYHGDMSRMEAEQLLMSNLNSPGAFLMRKSSRVNAYVLSIKTLHSDGKTPRIRHYNITMKDDGQFGLSGCFFLTLTDLVDYFVNVVYTGLPPTMPKHPCVRPPPMMQDISRETKDKWEIPREELRFVKKLGHGSFGEVWLGKWNGSVDVAIKTMKEGKMNAEDFLGEARVMKNLRHPNILALYAVCSQEEPLLIVTEFMSEGALLELLREQPINLQLQLHIATQASAGMEYLESKQLIHRDLAARNILVGQCYVCKVADFGLSKLYEDAIYRGQQQSKGRMPIKWTAPEALLQQKYSSKSDVWSFGILLMEILTAGAVPYPGFTNQQVVEALMEGYRMPQPPRCPPKLYELIYKCWSVNPEERPTFYFIHDYLENFDVQSENAYYGTDHC